MHDLFLIHRSDLSYSELAKLLELHRVDTVVDARSSDEPGDFSFSVLGALCSAFGFGYLRRGDRLAPAPVGDRDREALSTAVGSLAEVAKHSRVALLVDADLEHLPPAARAHGLLLFSIAKSGVVRLYEDHLPMQEHSP